MRSFKGLTESYLQKRQDEKYWRGKTIRDAANLICTSIGGAVGALGGFELVAACLPILTCTLITPALITATAATGFLISYFISGRIEGQLSGIPHEHINWYRWREDQLRSAIASTQGLPLSTKDRQTRVKKLVDEFDDDVRKTQQEMLRGRVAEEIDKNVSASITDIHEYKKMLSKRKAQLGEAPKKQQPTERDLPSAEFKALYPASSDSSLPSSLQAAQKEKVLARHKEQDIPED